MDHPELTGIIYQAIQNDDPDLLGRYVPEKMPSFMCLDLNEVSDISLLQDKPPLISIAVYFGAKNCASLLVETGSELDATDDIRDFFSKSIFQHLWSIFIIYRESVHFLASPNRIEDVLHFLLDHDTDFNAVDDDVNFSI
ncbi:hypothetical protein TRFO_13262 [Tritrichomonas foetus]|uniref:Ankyrin repeat protein n=1 Tax=Tritrichomonas foetus TaxID=1144522 RepID=A0A1J4KYM0_9EUKA|nr:hypothetical protein TRFO_13262 [Tritrichomonas foetus]|eukprot:OHT16258.1 hypothetical protein TRFO_13262 [Tritrichomonas foetus]